MFRHFSKARPIEQIHHNKLQKDVKPGSVSSQESTFLLRVIQASHCNKVIACLHMHLMHAREMFYYISVPRMIHPWPTGQLQAAVCGKEEPSVSCKCCLSATRNSYQCANGKKKESVMSPAEALSTAPRRPACLEVPSRCVIKVQTWLTMDKYESKRSRQHSAPRPQPRGTTCGRCRR